MNLIKQVYHSKWFPRFFFVKPDFFKKKVEKSVVEILVVGSRKEWDVWVSDYLDRPELAKYDRKNNKLKLEHSYGIVLYRFFPFPDVHWRERVMGLRVDSVIYLGGEQTTYPADMINFLSTRTYRFWRNNGT